jgi:hypothetical protein
VLSVPSEAQRLAEQGLALLDKAQAPLKALGSGAQAPAHPGVVRQAAERLAAYSKQVEPVCQAAADSKLQSAAAGKRALECAEAQLKEAERGWASSAKNWTVPLGRWRATLQSATPPAAARWRCRRPRSPPAAAAP